MDTFIEQYKQRLITMINNIEKEDIISIINILKEQNNRNIWIIGNGGSAATSSQLAINLSKMERKENGGIIESLSDNSSMITSIAETSGYDNIFSEQLSLKACSKDILIAISCSGNSPNIVKALEYAKSRDMTVIGISGFSGGTLKEYSDVNLHIPSGPNDYGLVEDVHSLIGYLLEITISNYSSDDCKDNIQNIFDNTIETIKSLDPDDIKSLISLLKERDLKGNIFIIGNGVDATVASHMSNDFGIGLKRRNLLKLNVQSLADNLPVITAAGNDIGFSKIYKIQLEDRIKRDDLLLVLNSGKISETISLAMDVARNNSATIYGCITNYDKDILKETDFKLNFDIHNVQLVSFFYLVLDHIVYTYFVEVYGAQNA